MKKPRHWTGKNIPTRIKDLGVEVEEIYYAAYPILSVYIHSGATGYVGLNEQQIETCYGFCHIIAQQVFSKATVIIGEEMKLTKAIEPFYKILGEVVLTPGKEIVKEQIEYLESIQNSDNN